MFFDDILVDSPDVESHKKDLSTALKVLRDHKLYAKLSKCAFAVPQISYLGHIISEKGVATDPAKVEAMRTWRTPQSVKELRGFLGLTGYYRKFIKGYGQITSCP